MKLKKGDKVIVKTGKDRGKTGSIERVIRDEDKVIVEGLNTRKKTIKKNGDKPGAIIEVSAPMHVSNVMLVDPKGGEATRVGKKKVGDKYVRVAKKSGSELK